MHALSYVYEAWFRFMVGAGAGPPFRVLTATGVGRGFFRRQKCLMGHHRSVDAAGVIPFPKGTKRLMGVAHRRLKYGGGWSFFICPGCAAQTPLHRRQALRRAALRTCGKQNLNRAQTGVSAPAAAQLCDNGVAPAPRRPTVAPVVVPGDA
jgi:hypothetical protein